MFLEVSVGSNEPKNYLLKGRLLIGTAAPCDLILPVKGLSRKHVLVTRENGEYFVTDQGSTNGRGDERGCLYRGGLLL
jgi:pSer/pThr/pTyr-binding forkhead associated (FHA) protein